MKKGKRRERKRPLKAEPTNKNKRMLYCCPYLLQLLQDVLVSLVHEHAEFLLDGCNRKVRGHKDF